MLWIILGITVSYLIGSIPTGYILARCLKGIDIRKFGSGNIGATNIFRVLGRTAGIIVLVLDGLKGYIPVTCLGNFLSSRSVAISQEGLWIILGLACIIGHNWTVFLRFKGGKGIATSAGVLFALAFKINGLAIVLGLVILTWISAFIITRIVSLASVLATLVLPIFTLLFKQPKEIIFLSICLCLFVILRHKSNITRILTGRESRLF